MKISSTSLFLLTFKEVASFSQLYGQPVIGILSYPETEKNTSVVEENSAVQESFSSYFDASYVKWIEQSGARVAPIRYDLPPDEIASLFSKLNGVLFTGGPDMPQTDARYYQAAQQLFDLVNTNGDNDVPLWGTCLGFETISSIASGVGDAVLTNFDAEKISLPLNAVDESARMINGMGSDMLETLETANITTNWHTFGVSQDDFSKLVTPSGFIIVSVNNDRVGKTFVSTIEHDTKPIYATQWHPEANQFDGDDKRGDSTPDRSSEAVDVVQFMSKFFVGEARRNDHTFGEDEWKESVIGGDLDGMGIIYDGFVYHFV